MYSLPPEVHVPPASNRSITLGAIERSRSSGDAKDSVPAGGWAALVAGPAPWATDYTGPVRLVSFLEVFALAASAVTVWHAAVNAPSTVSRWLAITCTLGAALLATTPISRLVQRAALSRNFRINFALRSLALTMMTVSSLGILRGWLTLLFLTNAVAFGADASLTAREVGWRPRAFRWWTSFLVSGLHWGIVGGVLAAIVRDPFHATAGAVPPFIVMHATVIIALVVASTLGSLMIDVDRQKIDGVAAALVVEHRQRAHWLHDDVCAQLRLTSLRLQTGAVAPNEVVGMLDDLDHEIRLRQLDELIASGSIHVAEALQPFIRRAQNHHVTIEQVPSFEDIDFDMNQTEAVLFRRAVSILTSNALNAGATRLAFDIGIGDAFMTLTVSDDGTGFETPTVTDGRGLWSLRNDLRPGGIEIGRVANGAAVTATIPIARRSADGVHPAR